MSSMQRRQESIALRGKTPLPPTRRFLTFDVASFVRNRIKSLFTFSFRVAIRTFFPAVYVLLLSRTSRRKTFTLHWSSEDSRTIGDYLPLPILGRLLISWGHSVNVVITRVTPDNQFWSTLSTTSRERLIQDWIDATRVIVPDAEVILRRQERGGNIFGKRHFSLTQGILGPIISDGLLSWIYRLAPAFCLSREALFLDDLKMDEQELRNLGLPNSFVAWHVRVNQQYAVDRSSSSDEILADFIWLVKKFGQPVVLLSTVEGIETVVTTVRDSKKILEEEKSHLIVPLQTFAIGMRIALTSETYAQCWGGGMAIPIIYSRVPYYVVEAKEWPIHPTPWRSDCQRAVSSGMVRTTLSHAFGSEPLCAPGITGTWV